ncbi:hypothetical protein ACJZ2D_013373 [Fusarium nematophilum]
MDYIDSLQVDGWQSLQAAAREAMASKQQFAAWLEQLTIARRECMRSVFGKILARMKDTGFDENGLEFSILWPYESGAKHCVKVPPEDDQEWFLVLKDKEWSAIFAVATNMCLETPSYRYRKIPAAPWDGAKMLSTFVLPNISGIVPSTAENRPGKEWQIKHLEWYWNGEVGGKVRFSAWKVPDAATELKFPRSRFHRVPRRFWSLLPRTSQALVH